MRLVFPEDHMRRFIEVVNRHNGPIVRAANRANEQYRRLQPQLDRAANRANEQYRRLQPQLDRLAEQFRELEEGPRRRLIQTFTFARGGWHEAPLMEVTVGSLRTLVDELVDKPDEEVKTELDLAIPAYFRRDDYRALWSMVERWDLYTGWREQVFEDAFWAHRNGKYTLSITALAPQIEGMLRHETGDRSSGIGGINPVNKALGFSYKRSEPPTPPPTAADLEERLKKLLDQDVLARYETAERVSLEHALHRVNELYRYVDFSDPQRVHSVNRHAILHGVYEDFDEVTSIKLFCAVELVHEVVIAYREEIES